MTIRSGAAWVPKFPGSHSVDDLETAFQAKVQKFVHTLSSAGATVTVNATYRPPERAFLMHWAWEIVKQHVDAHHIPAMAGVDIDWWHGDQAASEAAAQEMVDGYGLRNLGVAPALNSRHTERKAIDMNLSWTGTLLIANADGTTVTISSAPRDGTNGALIVVGATYGVIHFLHVSADRAHWSTDGH